MENEENIGLEEEFKAQGLFGALSLLEIRMSNNNEHLVAVAKDTVKTLIHEEGPLNRDIIPVAGIARAYFGLVVSRKGPEIIQLASPEERPGRCHLFMTVYYLTGKRYFIQSSLIEEVNPVMSGNLLMDFDDAEGYAKDTLEDTYYEGLKQ